MLSLVSGPFIVMFVLATFDPDETNSLLILNLFALFRKSQVSLSNCSGVLKAKNDSCLTVCATAMVVAHWSSSSFVVVLKLMANCSHYE